ncbi:MAG: glycosyltransferase family 4 protein, partial [Thermomicrobiales bacterium]
AARETNPWYTMLKPYFAFLMSRLDERICVSEPARRNIEQHFPDDYRIIPNGIDIDRYSEDVDPFPWPESGPRILFVGRFNEARKGFKYLLRAMPMIQQQFPTARLTVVGPGDPARFSDLLQRYLIRGVEFVGEVPSADLPRYYSSCDLFCAPSIHGESFGLVLLEAMASRKPVVASDIPGYASVMTNNLDGLLVQAKDSMAIALAVVRLLSDTSLCNRLSTAGRKTAEKYAWPSVAAQVLKVYDIALARRQPALAQGSR